MKVSPPLFNIYVDKVIIKGLTRLTSFIRRTQKVNCLPFAVCQVIIADTEDGLQRDTNKSNETGVYYNMKIYSGKNKVFAFKGKDTIRVKIVVNKKQFN
jgi:hypothetical protein